MVPDKTFGRYISSKEDAYDDGTTLSADSLMQQCANKYKLLVQQGKWNAPTSEEKEIIALKAELKQIKLATKSRNRTPTKKKTNFKRSTKKYVPRAREGWTNIPQKEGEELKPKKVKGKTYWWCEHNKFWARHKPEDCKKVDAKPQPKGSNTNTEGETQNGKSASHVVDEALLDELSE